MSGYQQPPYSYTPTQHPHNSYMQQAYTQQTSSEIHSHRELSSAYKAGSTEESVIITFQASGFFVANGLLYYSCKLPNRSGVMELTTVPIMLHKYDNESAKWQYKGVGFKNITDKNELKTYLESIYQVLHVTFKSPVIYGSRDMKREDFIVLSSKSSTASQTDNRQSPGTYGSNRPPSRGRQIRVEVSAASRPAELPAAHGSTELPTVAATVESLSTRFDYNAWEDRWYYFAKYDPRTGEKGIKLPVIIYAATEEHFFVKSGFGTNVEALVKTAKQSRYIYPTEKVENITVAGSLIKHYCLLSHVPLPSQRPQSARRLHSSRDPTPTPTATARPTRRSSSLNRENREPNLAGQDRGQKPEKKFWDKFKNKKR